MNYEPCSKGMNRTPETKDNKKQPFIPNQNRLFPIYRFEAASYEKKSETGYWNILRSNSWTDANR